jgi:hypothetical protein
VNFGGSCDGRCWYILWPFGLFDGHLSIFYSFWVYFMVIWYFFPVLVSFSEKNLATLDFVTSLNDKIITGHCFDGTFIRCESIELLTTLTRLAKPCGGRILFFFENVCNVCMYMYICSCMYMYVCKYVCCVCIYISTIDRLCCTTRLPSIVRHQVIINTPNIEI